MKKIPVRLGAASYGVLIANGLLRRTGALIREICGDSSRCAVITSPRIQNLRGTQLERSLRSSQLAYSILTVPDGERYKSLGSIESLMRKMAAAGLDRNSVVLAFGGGVIGDLAGFAASIYMRGIPVIQIPTTLLAQVDASIGGKTGVNLPVGKNLVGTFHQPRTVLIDPQVLGTLPEREYRAGFFEVIKCGVIRDAGLFRSIERNQSRFLARHPAFLLKAIEASVRVKADVVSRDEREGGLRRILNFGHTIGHALEAEGGYKRLLHGEAVGWGMIAAARIGEQMGTTPKEVAARIERVVLQCGLLPRIRVKEAAILRRIRSDKKTLHGVLHFVLPTAIGKTMISDQVKPRHIRNAVDYLNKLSAR